MVRRARRNSYATEIEVRYLIYENIGTATRPSWNYIGEQHGLFPSREEVRQWWNRASAHPGVEVRVEWAKEGGKFVSFSGILFELPPSQ